jgi:hypothetical protein
MHAMDLVGINGITRVLLIYTCQQGVYPRGHVLPLRLPIRVCTTGNYVKKHDQLCKSYSCCYSLFYDALCAYSYASLNVQIEKYENKFSQTLFQYHLHCDMPRPTKQSLSI